MNACDLLVAGAGPAGAAAAVTAARRGLDVILVHDPRPGLAWAGWRCYADQWYCCSDIERCGRYA